MRIHFSRTAISFVLATFVLDACSGGAAPGQCRSNEQCVATARCQSSVCVADGAPAAAIKLPPGIEAFALVQLDGTASNDPDAGDGIVEHAWTSDSPARDVTRYRS